MVLYEQIITLPRIKDRIKVEIVNRYESLCWIAYRENTYGEWEKIPAMSRAECRAFPKSVGFAATAILAGYKADLAKAGAL